MQTYSLIFVYKVLVCAIELGRKSLIDDMKIYWVAKNTAAVGFDITRSRDAGDENQTVGTTPLAKEACILILTT